MKTDNYINLCLDQAALSPLRYRHGCIIVSGGKVIGQGFNDHRAGFSGGALKTGSLPARSLDTAGLAELKKKHKLKRDLKDPNEHSTTTFTPFEAMGGGQLANTPLSMHSEMMAIHSALSASSKLASTAVSYQKPCFKLSGDSKRKARLRRDALKTYVETICKVALTQSATEQRAGKPQVQEWRFEGAPSQSDHMEKHRTKNQKNHQHEKDHNSGQQHKQRRQYARKLPAQDIIVAPCHSTPDSSVQRKAAKEISNARPTTHNKKTKHSASPPKTSPMLVPNGRTAEKKRTIVERQKNPRLNGADLYVARQGWSISAESGATACCEVVEEAQVTTTKPKTGSLHDELLNSGPVLTSPLVTAAPSSAREPSVLSSRPCYRCIAYMNSVGIKRVFWTTNTGEWESAKVRDLVDSLEDLGTGDMTDVHTTLSNVFVTKHEVLMLRRTMGGGS
ncbi:hypothetical protein BU23DRAFT_540574 [Bimuria novae-zelandiae CBS 107.79]|uniref:Uncharacterized protein n=1 Tax=Bimuria novae-zelandiae CBS 107.79 TaxID=1447943 RepID=A0A6A5UY16_9PLEO|nr:hypothetical protein BU23DRAFT_540574 [Bimuria novae-zelandiae CBS 107.79]